jgi:hypothetical protein
MKTKLRYALLTTTALVALGLGPTIEAEAAGNKRSGVRSNQAARPQSHLYLRGWRGRARNPIQQQAKGNAGTRTRLWIRTMPWRPPPAKGNAGIRTMPVAPPPAKGNAGVKIVTPPPAGGYGKRRIPTTGFQIPELLQDAKDARELQGIKDMLPGGPAAGRTPTPSAGTPGQSGQGGQDPCGQEAPEQKSDPFRPEQKTDPFKDLDRMIKDNAKEDARPGAGGIKDRSGWASQDGGGGDVTTSRNKDGSTTTSSFDSDGGWTWVTRRPDGTSTVRRDSGVQNPDGSFSGETEIRERDSRNRTVERTVIRTEAREVTVDGQKYTVIDNTTIKYDGYGRQVGDKRHSQEWRLGPFWTPTDDGGRLNPWFKKQEYERAARYPDKAPARGPVGRTHIPGHAPDGPTRPGAAGSRLPCVSQNAGKSARTGTERTVTDFRQPVINPVPGEGGAGRGPGAGLDGRGPTGPRINPPDPNCANGVC